jgi:hypothetical protein
VAVAVVAAVALEADEVVAVVVDGARSCDIYVRRYEISQ